MADPTALFNFPPAGASLEQLSPSEYDQAIRCYIQTLDGINPYFWVAGALGDEKLLDILDPSVNTIPYLYVLYSQISALVDQRKDGPMPDNIKPGGELFSKLATFLDSFDPMQIRYVGKTWRNVIELLNNIARAVSQPAVALVPIRNAMTRMDPTLGTFTSTHLLYLRLCHMVRAHFEALPVLEQYIHSFPSTPVKGGEFTLPCADHFTSAGYITTASGLSAKVSSSDVQEYFLLGANTYLALRQWGQAQLFLEYILTTPAQNVATGLMAEAYRKWVLVSCLVENTSSLKGANSIALRSIKAASRAYDALVEVFNSGDAAKLHAEIDTGASIWQEDGNKGLVRELQAHQSKVFVKNLQKTYAAAPLANVATWINKSPQAVEQYLQALIDEGFLNAAIEQPSADATTKILRFHDANHCNMPATQAEEQQLAELMAQAKKTQELADHIKAATHRLTVMRDYVDHVKKRAKNKEGADPGLGGDTMDVSWEAHDEDEDMMADL
ncbi:hypothetical protein IWZ03DRAFT_384092 [Phyllosticta citriasiana]|uniref:COP9 signalosome complex subunit 3 N-terminal helical repeats domain-containing protein n=1 Tax=Phyllosticta citriasiana TaxID=595635 RepID=A0ABR1KFS7_9PEZI